MERKKKDLQGRKFCEGRGEIGDLEGRGGGRRDERKKSDCNRDDTIIMIMKLRRKMVRKEKEERFVKEEAKYE